MTDSLNSLITHLKAYSDAQKTSIQNISLELRTPLMYIQGYAEGIKYEYFDDKSEAVDIIIEESKSLALNVDQLLTLSKLDTLNQPLEIIDVNLTEAVNTYITKLQGYAYKQNKQIIFIKSDDIMASIRYYFV